MPPARLLTAWIQKIGPLECIRAALSRSGICSGRKPCKSIAGPLLRRAATAFANGSYALAGRHFSDRNGLSRHGTCTASPVRTAAANTRTALIASATAFGTIAVLANARFATAATGSLGSDVGLHRADGYCLGCGARTASTIGTATTYAGAALIARAAGFSTVAIHTHACFAAAAAGRRSFRSHVGSGGQKRNEQHDKPMHGKISNQNASL